MPTAKEECFEHDEGAPDEFIGDIKEEPVEDESLERLQGKKDYEKHLHTEHYRREYRLMKRCVVISPIQRIIIALHFFENHGKGYTFREIQRRLELPLTTVYREYKRALRKYIRWQKRRELK